MIDAQNPLTFPVLSRTHHYDSALPLLFKLLGALFSSVMLFTSQEMPAQRRFTRNTSAA